MTRSVERKGEMACGLAPNASQPSVGVERPVLRDMDPHTELTLDVRFGGYESSVATNTRKGQT